MKKLTSLAFAIALAFAGCAEGNHEPTVFDGTGGPGSGGSGSNIGQIVTPPPKLGDDLGAARTSSANSVFFNEGTGEYDPAAVVATIYFGFDKYVISKGEQDKLNALNATGANLIAAGYSDHFGTDQYNQGLSDRRAQSTKSYLTGIGYQDAKIEIQAFGKRYASRTGSRAEVAKDRKVVIVNRDHKSGGETISAVPAL